MDRFNHLSRQNLKVVGGLIVPLFILFAFACQKPINMADKYAQEAELKAQTATTSEDWRTVDDLWRQALIALEDKSYSEEILDLQERYSQGRLDALLEMALLVNARTPCGTRVPQSGWQKPSYWGKIGYVTVSRWSDSSLYMEVKESLQNRTFDQRHWQISTARTDQNSSNQVVPLGTRVQVIRTSLQHQGYGTYAGELLVRDIETKETFWIDTLNFSLTDPTKCLISEDHFD